MPHTKDKTIANLRQELREVRWLSRLLVLLVTFAVLLFLYYGVYTSSEHDEAAPGLPLGEAAVQVLNGSDPRAPLASSLVRYLRTTSDAGTVLSGLNAPSPRFSQTLLLLHGASPAAGARLAEDIGLSPERVSHGTPTPLNGDLTIIIGDDYESALADHLFSN